MASVLDSNRAVWVRALTRDMVLFSWARYTLLPGPLHPGVQMGTGKFNAGGSPTME